MGFYEQTEKFNKIMSSFKNGGSFKYDDILEIIRKQTGFSEVKLDKELKRLQDRNLCYRDYIEGIVHFKDASPTDKEGVGEELSSFDRVISSTPIPPISSSAEKDKED